MKKNHPRRLESQRIQTGYEHLPMHWKIGDFILSLYEVRQILGQGGMGTVYSIFDHFSHSEQTVKSSKPEIFTNTNGRENFIREAEIWVKLGAHPHLVRCFSVLTLGRIPRIFIEYVQGGNLHEWIQSRKLYKGGKQRAMQRILDVAIQMAWGLHYAHEQGVVYLDVKPRNVMWISLTSIGGCTRAQSNWIGRMSDPTASPWQHCGPSWLAST